MHQQTNGNNINDSNFDKFGFCTQILARVHYSIIKTLLGQSIRRSIRIIHILLQKIPVSILDLSWEIQEGL